MTEKKHPNKTIFSKIYRELQEFSPIVFGFIFFGVVFCYGMFIYMSIEGWNLLDSFFQVVITLSTVGFEELHPLSDAGRLHTSFLILLGVGGFAYLLGTFTEALIEGHIQLFWGKRKMLRQIEALRDHYIVCGYGRIGSVVTRELNQAGWPTVVIESDPDVSQALESDAVLHLLDDATSDQVLIKAGIQRAKAIITTLDNDVKNLYVTLSAKQLAPNLTVIARAEDEASRKKLDYAGADRVLTPHLLGGLRMAQIVLRPTVINFLDMAMQGSNLELQMEELLVSAHSKIVEKNLIESKIRAEYDLIIIAMKKSNDEMIYNPKAQEVIHQGDTLIVVGKRSDLEKVREIL